MPYDSLVAVAPPEVNNVLKRQSDDPDLLPPQESNTSRHPKNCGESRKHCASDVTGREGADRLDAGIE